MVVAMNKDAISIIQQQADTDDKKQKILIVDDSKFNTFGYQYSVQIKAKVENDSQMYSLKLHTLWSPMKKDGDIGIIGYFDAVN